jgi:hypothetical protein
MPYINVSTYVDIDEDVSVDDFLSQCGDRDIEEVVEWLGDNGCLPLEPETIPEREFESTIQVLRESRLRLTAQEEDTIIAMARKYGIVSL